MQYLHSISMAEQRKKCSFPRFFHTLVAYLGIYRWGGIDDPPPTQETTFFLQGGAEEARG